MSQIYTDNSLSIGRTPLVRLNRIGTHSSATLLAKIEGRNPAYSVKCRIGASMIWDAEDRVLTPGAKGMGGAIGEAEAIAAGDPDRYVLLHQFKNPANPAIHLKTTGPEIWDDTDGDIDVLVSGVGTGGTITGVSRYFKEVKGKQILSVAVEPEDSPVIKQKLAGEDLQPGPHKIQGIGAGFIPDTLDLSLVDRVEQVSNDEAIDYARRLAKEEGILAGISCGAATAVAARLAEEDEFKDKNIVVILPDSGERYLSSVLYEGIV